MYTRKFQCKKNINDNTTFNDGIWTKNPFFFKYSASCIHVLDPFPFRFDFTLRLKGRRKEQKRMGRRVDRFPIRFGFTLD